jgi:hypothetical protein
MIVVVDTEALRIRRREIGVCANTTLCGGNRGGNFRPKRNRPIPMMY